MIRINRAASFLTILVASITYYVPAQANLSPLEQTLLRRYLDFEQRRLNLPRRSHELEPQLQFESIAFRCLALATAERRKPQSRVMVSLKDLADGLVVNSDLNRDGQVGWGLAPHRDKNTCSGPGSWDAFKDGSCNPKNTEYMFQTALVVRCLSETYDLTKNIRYLQVAKRAISDSWTIGTDNIPGCSKCFAYWYSYNKNDAGRYVRNTSILMGSAVAHLYRITGIDKYKQRATAVANEELWEAQSGLSTYYGRLDPFTRRHPGHPVIEDHQPLVAFALYDIGAGLETQRYDRASAKLITDWHDCSLVSCRRTICKGWSGNPDMCLNRYSFYYCSLKKLGIRYPDYCQMAERATEMPTAFEIYNMLYDREYYAAR